LFFVGVGFGLLANNGVLDRLRDSTRWAWVSLLALVVVAAIANFRIGSVSSLREDMLIASELVFLLYSNRWTMRLLGTPLSRFVGRISFPLYLVHFSIIVSLMSYLVIRFHDAGALTPWAVATICTITIAASIAAAAVFERVETRTLRGVYAALASIRRPL
jgi:peptidoglycan/LPS O-acetylase OafA/YrhL